jgi:hypothetical protein
LIAIFYEITAVDIDYMELTILEISFLYAVTTARRAVSNSSILEDILCANTL